MFLKKHSRIMTVCQVKEKLKVSRSIGLKEYKNIFFFLKNPNILLNCSNYGPKFNFIGTKKIQGVPNFF